MMIVGDDVKIRCCELGSSLKYDDVVAGIQKWAHATTYKLNGVGCTTVTNNESLQCEGGCGVKKKGTPMEYACFSWPLFGIM